MNRMMPAYLREQRERLARFFADGGTAELLGPAPLDFAPLTATKR